MTVNLLNMKLFGAFDVPRNIIQAIHRNHPRVLALIWRFVVGGHDVDAKNKKMKNQKKLNFKAKLPAVKCNSYNKAKRKQKEETALSSIWNTVKISITSLKKRIWKSNVTRKRKTSEKKDN